MNSTSEPNLSHASSIFDSFNFFLDTPHSYSNEQDAPFLHLTVNRLLLFHTIHLLLFLILMLQLPLRLLLHLISLLQIFKNPLEHTRLLLTCKISIANFHAQQVLLHLHFLVTLLILWHLFYLIILFLLLLSNTLSLFLPPLNPLPINKLFLH